jgi:cytochrome c oxidase assembly factor CtaG
MRDITRKAEASLHFPNPCLKIPSGRREKSNDGVTTLSIVAHAWRADPAGLAICAALLILYLAAGGFSRSSLLWFLAAELFLAAVVCSPLDLLARQYLFTAEAVERVLIALTAPYLFLLSLPPRLSLPVNRYIAWMAGMGALLIWFLPAPLNRALSSEPIRAVEFATLFAAGLMFWWPIHAPSPDRRMPLLPASLLYLAAATVWCSLLGLFLAFAQPSIYSGYANPPDTLHIADSLVVDWSFTRENDQQTGGLLFWIGSATVLLSEVMAVYIRWYRSSSKD